MKCPDEKTLLAHAAEALDPRRSDWIAKHCEQCPDCRERSAELRADEALLREALAEPIDFEAMSQRIWNRLKSDDETL